MTASVIVESNAFEDRARAVKAMRLVRFLARFGVTDTKTVRAYSTSDRELICRHAHVNVASERTWSAVEGILDAFAAERAPLVAS